MCNRRSERLLSILLCLALAAVLLSGCTTPRRAQEAERAAAAESAEAQDPAGETEEGAFSGLKSFTAETLDGGSFAAEDLQDADLTAINFWATYCGPCVQEMPDLAALEQELPERVRLIGCCLDAPRETDLAKQILESAGFTGTTLSSLDGDLLTLALMVQYIPTTVFVDSEGKLVGKAIVGPQADLKASCLDAINEALRELDKEEI